MRHEYGIDKMLLLLWSKLCALGRPKFATGILAFAVGQLGVNKYHLTHEKQMELVVSVTFLFMLLFNVPRARSAPWRSLSCSSNFT